MSFPMKTLDPFLFCVYHLDHYPAGDASMAAPRHGNGADFNPTADYRMYHGDDIPGKKSMRGFAFLVPAASDVRLPYDTLIRNV
jgi:hypothetical protein